MGRVSDLVFVCVCLSVCMSFQRILSANRSPKLRKLSNLNLVGSLIAPTPQSSEKIGDLRSKVKVTVRENVSQNLSKKTYIFSVMLNSKMF